MEQTIVDCIVCTFVLMFGLVFLQLSRSMSDEAMRRVRIRGILPLYWILNHLTGMTFATFARKTMKYTGFLFILCASVGLFYNTYTLIF